MASSFEYDGFIYTKAFGDWHRTQIINVESRGLPMLTDEHADAELLALSEADE